MGEGGGGVGGFSGGGVGGGNRIHFARVTCHFVHIIINTFISLT